MKIVNLARSVLVLVLVLIFTPAFAQEYIADAPAWCQAALRLPFPSKPVSGTLSGLPFNLKQATLTPIPKFERYQLVIEGEGPDGGIAPRICFTILSNEVEGKSFNLPHQKKSSSGIRYSDECFYLNGEQFNLHFREYSARVVFQKKRPDGLVPGYISFRAQSKLKKWKDSSLIGFFYAQSKK
ncbi:MAG: hypothetical protein SFY67_04080 [Candidatus Melainabacteria bacterium]|nr:hypothetical protein [Candidatus Melainabacteria bacterium]